MRLAVTYWVFRLPEVWHCSSYAGCSDLIAESGQQQVARPICYAYETVKHYHSHCQFV